MPEKITIYPRDLEIAQRNYRDLAAFAQDRQIIESVVNEVRPTHERVQAVFSNAVSAINTKFDNPEYILISASDSRVLKDRILDQDQYTVMAGTTTYFRPATGEIVHFNIYSFVPFEMQETHLPGGTEFPGWDKLRRPEQTWICMEDGTELGYVYGGINPYDTSKQLVHWLLSSPDKDLIQAGQQLADAIQTYVEKAQHIREILGENARNNLISFQRSLETIVGKETWPQWLDLLTFSKDSALKGSWDLYYDTQDRTLWRVLFKKRPDKKHPASMADWLSVYEHLANELLRKSKVSNLKQLITN